MDPLLHTWDEGTVKTMDFTEQWTSSEEDKNRKVGKVMTTVFWDAYGIIYIDYLPSKQMINDDYYTLPY